MSFSSRSRNWVEIDLRGFELFLVQRDRFSILRVFMNIMKNF
jgi:hypothetical protein